MPKSTATATKNKKSHHPPKRPRLSLLLEAYEDAQVLNAHLLTLTQQYARHLGVPDSDSIPWALKFAEWLKKSHIKED